MVALLTVSLFGCGGGGGKVDETKSLDEVKAEAEKMDVKELKATAEKWHKAIMAKQDDVEKIMAKIKDIPVLEQAGDEAKALQADLSELNKSLGNLKTRFQVYYNKLKEKGGDISGLEL